MITREQERARWAYRVVGKVETDKQVDYKNAVTNLGSHILQSGLCAALAELERNKDRGGQAVRENLADGEAGISHLNGVTADNLHQHVQGLEVDQYIQVTREVLHCASWLKRAVQALF